MMQAVLAGMGRMAWKAWMGGLYHQDQMRWECRTRQLAPQTGQCSVDPDLRSRGSMAVD